MSVSITFSQDKKIDSLINLSNSIDSDSLKAVIYNEIAELYLSKNQTNNAIIYSSRSLIISSQINNDKTLMESLLIQAGISVLNNELNYALKYYLQAANNAEKLGDSLKLSQIFNEIGLIYFEVEAFTKASEYFEKSYKISKNNNYKYLEENNLKNLAYSQKNDENYEKAIETFNKLSKYYENKSDTTEYINTLTNIAYLYNVTEQYQNAFDTNKLIYDILYKNNDIINLSFILNNIAYNCVFLEDFENAILYFKQSLTIAEQFKMHKDRADAYSNLGICYQNAKNYNKSIDNLIKAEQIYDSLKIWSEVARIDNIIALIYFYNDDFYNAQLYSQEAIFVAEQNKEFEELQYCYETYSMILQKANDFENALNYYKKYLSIKDSLMLQNYIKEQKLADIQFDAEKAEKELKLAIANEEFNDLTLKQLKTEAEKKEKELELLRRDNEVQELEKQKMEQSLILAQQQLEAKKKEQEISNLEKEKEIQQQEIMLKEAQEKEQQKEIQLLQSQQEKQQLELEKQAEEKRRMQHISILFGIIFILILLGLILLGKKNKVLKKQKIEITQKNTDLAQKNEEISAQKEHLQHANEEINAQKENLQQKNEEILAINEELNVQKEEISEQKNVIEKKNKDITDSIQYAKRIQTVIIPSLDALKDNNLKHFVFFKPRDIVSGDFYWVKEIQISENEKQIVATAADCTGHGVPGAFMSMLGISYLNEIVGQNKVSQPNVILNNLRKKVKEVLQQKGEVNETKDGMDMALISYNTKSKILQFAGANNPLLHIRKHKLEENIDEDKKNPTFKTTNSQYKLTEFKPDKMPVGIYIRESESFTNHQISIQEDDTIYIYSDGYIDQFGGKEGRKFLTKYFKLLLLENQEETMERQRRILKETLIDWLDGNFEQLDDILVMGIKF